MKISRVKVVNILRELSLLTKGSSYRLRNEGSSGSPVLRPPRGKPRRSNEPGRAEKCRGQQRGDAAAQAAKDGLKVKPFHCKQTLGVKQSKYMLCE